MSSQDAHESADLSSLSAIQVSLHCFKPPCYSIGRRVNDLLSTCFFICCAPLLPRLACWRSADVSGRGVLGGWGCESALLLWPVSGWSSCMQQPRWIVRFLILNVYSSRPFIILPSPLNYFFNSDFFLRPPSCVRQPFIVRG